MSVNPNLATLMGLIDELQDQMPEGKYLEAMNALRDLHASRTHPAPQPVRPPPQPVRPPPQPVRIAIALPPALVVPEGYVRLTRAEEVRMAEMRERRRHHENNLDPVVKAWREGSPSRNPIRKATRDSHPTMTEAEWCGLTAEQRLPIVISALRWIFSDDIEDWSPNPDAEVCPFMSRHAIGRWFDPARRLIENYNGESYDRARWDCVCGSKEILCKNWQAHKNSEKHRKWEREGRNVSRGRIQIMRGHVVTQITFGNPANGVAEGKVHEAEILGVKIKWTLPYDSDRKQDRNEWTHPELFAGKPLDWTPPKNYTLPLMAQLEQPAVFRYGAVPLARTYLPVPNKREMWCQRTRTNVPMMTEEDYAIFISMED